MKPLFTFSRRVALGALLALATFPALAADSKPTIPDVKDAWARATAQGAPNGAAYMTFMGKGASDVLLSASADVSKIVELHMHIMENGVAKMRPVSSIAIPATGKVEMVPGGLHVMFLGLKEPLKEGASFPLKLTFEQGGETTVTVHVRAAGAMGGAMPMDHKAADHGKGMEHGKAMGK